MKKVLILLLLAAAIMPIAAEGAVEDDVLTVYAYDSFASDWGPAGTLIPAFEKETGIKVNLVSAGDAVEMISRIELEGDNTDADVVLGITDDFAYRAYPYLESYNTPIAESIPAELRFDSENRLIPFDYGAFAFVWDTECGLEKPETLSDLAKPEYKDKVILIDPRTSSVGLGLLLWTYNIYGDGDEFNAWWEAMEDNALTIADGWSSAYGLFTEGEAPIVLSYTTSPVYHVLNEDTTRYQALVFPEGHEATIEGIGIIKGTDKRAEAEKFVDFILTEAQLDIAIANSMYPANTAIELPEAFNYAPKPDKLFRSGATSPEKTESLVNQWLQIMTDN
ncbi:MAG: thiamine ABC transporter substrate-binding protein [Spirochaetes bacterium]|uniref:Thiamine ABC transporter substrate-binding protein n=1 Tax=Candidatus Ornithospirochaeta stercoripullorum TaxID=2840899 RepID=A0A9D9H5Z5_9SPIO|nr:thiamine ABC transporter substrate-binding protein [Candidatus Ornithospirochaeta stercoripullorum]